MRLYEDEAGREPAISEEPSVGGADELEGGGGFIALAVLLCVSFWFGVYLLAGGPLP
jgi:hypothetical protein